MTVMTRFLLDGLIWNIVVMEIELGSLVYALNSKIPLGGFVLMNDQFFIRMMT
jgi:hypothetical protein